MEKEELIDYIKKVKEETKRLEEVMDQKKKEEDTLKEIAESKTDKKSGFYKDAEARREEKHKEWANAFADRETHVKQSEQEIQKQKNLIIAKLEEKQKIVEENRNLNEKERSSKTKQMYSEIKELNASLYAKKQELKYFESTLPQNNDRNNEIVKNSKHEIEEVDKEIKEKIDIVNLLKEENSEEVYDNIKNEIEYIKQLSVENVDKEFNKKDDKELESKSEKTPENVNKREENNSAEKIENDKEQTQNEETQSENENQNEEKQPEDKENTSDEEKEKLSKQAEDKENTKDEEGNKDISSYYLNQLKSIEIEAATGKAYATYVSQKDKENITYFKQKEEEISIEDAIDNRKELYEKIDLKGVMKLNGIKSPIKQAILKSMVNPVILKTIEKDEDKINDYVKALIDGEKFPFEYTINLEDSQLSSKHLRFMNRRALNEAKIEGNEVTGAEKYHTIKSLFRNMKNKVKSLSKEEEKKQITDGSKENQTKPKENKFKKDLEVTKETIEKLENDREGKVEETYNRLSDEQKEALSGFSRKEFSKVQNFGIEHSVAVGLLEKYGKQEEQQTPEQEEEQK